MTRIIAFALLLAGTVCAQNTNPVPEWTTARADAQRSGWLRSDAYISPSSMSKPGFKFLWKVKLGKAGDTSLLSEPVTFSRFSGERGWKTLAALGSSSNTYFAVDNDLGTLYLDEVMSKIMIAPGTAACPGGMTSGLSRPVSLVVTEPVPRASGPALSFRGVVSAPDEGTPVEFASRSGGRGFAFPTAVAAPSGAAGVNSAMPPSAPPVGSAAAAAGRGAGGGRGAAGIYALTSDGMLRTIGRASGRETVKPWQFIPPERRASDLTVIGNVAYVATMNQCGGMPNGVSMMDMASADKATISWATGGGNPLGAPAFSENGTLYVSIGPDRRGSLGYSNSVVALDGKTLALKDSFTAPEVLASIPTVFTSEGKEFVAVQAKSGRIYLMDAASLGGSDHKTPLASTPATGGPGVIAGWRDNAGTTWVLASSAGPLPASAKFPSSNGTVTSGAIVAYKLASEGGKTWLEPAWVSADLTSPKAPIIVNGVAFALAGGSLAVPAVLHALDAATGKSVWSSGQTMTSYVDAGISASQGQVYVAAHDHTFYTFGFYVPTNK
jgi:hypothetical protein